MDNGKELRQLIESAGLSQKAALAIFNIGQARPISESHWKAYLAKEGSIRKANCPDEVVKRMKLVLKRNLHGVI